MLTWRGYIDGIHVTIYSSTMDPMGIYPLVNYRMENHHAIHVGKSTISTGPWLQSLFLCLPGRVAAIKMVIFLRGWWKWPWFDSWIFYGDFPKLMVISPNNEGIFDEANRKRVFSMRSVARLLSGWILWFMVDIIIVELMFNDIIWLIIAKRTMMLDISRITWSCFPHPVISRFPT